MSSADSARMQLAIRAFRATEPSAMEVQSAVRRARLALRRPRPRRTWLVKMAVLAVLAVGSMAYAKPGALRDWLAQQLGRAPASGASRSTPSIAPSAAPAAAERSQVRDEPWPAEPSGSGLSSSPSPAPAGAAATNSGGSSSSLNKPANARASGDHARSPLRSPADAGPAPASPGRGAASSGADAGGGGRAASAASVSDWGRVGHALAQGDEHAALRALDDLSESADERTRDKADLGRAQLYLANGEHDKACAIARSLTNRRAGSRIERQAQLLLRDCSR